ncbi:ankyrin-1-like [Mytilus trossulus]|uniref:ankyrin-1-like n=1 Tax=Mytilus trossulus TaxID=6551 RepID=UPI003005823F
MKFENWKNRTEKIKTLVEKKQVKLIMSCRLQVYKDRQMESLSFFQAYECNLQSAHLCLSKTEKQSIAEFYLKTNASKISELYDMFDCFPLLCQLYSKNSKLNIVDFFTNPFTVYKEEIDKLQIEGAHVKYCALALCVMFNNQLKEEWLTEDVDENNKTIIKNTYRACKVVAGTSRLVLRDELDSLTHTYIRKDGEVYRTIHDKLFDFLAFYFGSVMIYCLIKNANSRFIRERFSFERKSKNDEFTIIVPTRYQQGYINRMVDDWSIGKVQDVFCNINMDNCIFRTRFLLHIKDLAIPQQKQLSSSYDIDNNSTPLIQCCFIRDIDLVKWCLCHCTSHVNHCRNTDKVSPLYISSAYGYIEVVQMLINNKADINKCRDIGASPLFIACQNGHTEVVKMLINNKADINKCRDTGESPLYMACQKGHTKVVQMLINNKADINTCDNEECSPVYIACQNGHTEVVKMLINNKADINKCRDTGESPLYIACQNGHTKVVQMLINNKADINKCRDTGESPLYIACQNGHTEVVKMLINNKADINKCRDTGASPIFIACYKGHTDVVKMLINNKADINTCDNEECSPLFIACQNGHTEVVKMLINNKADINKCRDTGASPVYIACQDGHTEVVKMLINNKADINKCRDTGGVSPLCPTRTILFHVPWTVNWVNI